MRELNKVFILLFFFFCIILQANALIIYRPENSEDINEVRCYLKIEDEEGNDVTYSACKAYYAWYYAPEKLIKYQNKYYIDGGMACHVYLKTGKYKISVYTPKSFVSNFDLPDNLKKDWTSNYFEYNTENPVNVIFITPTANENGFYDGSWIVDYKAPKYFKFTRPYRR